ncbi:hypothetical protein JYT48_01905 [Mariprofundus ferrooxydans]|nr:hypothetical protein [Mariprofundus ferrooxydans]
MVLVLLLFGMSATAFLSGCTTTGEIKNQAMLRGFNAMQHENVGWNEPQARRSMQRMASLGSNAIVLIAFLEQDSASAVEVNYSNAVTFGQLQKAIEYAHDLDLKIILKPQMLVRNSWASAISHESQQGWNQWFESYQQHIVRFARFAAQNKVQAFVIGTELSKASGFVDWPGLIRQVRSVFPGQITYAAHNIDGLRAFPFWNELDAVSVTLYPSLGRSGQYDEMQALVHYTVAQLESVAKQFDLPLWVLEIGMPSAAGASLKPWEWQSLKHARVDLQLQRDAIDIWLRALDQPWVDGVFIWAWYSDAASGGRHNADYTPQNKPAERVIQRYWRF